MFFYFSISKSSFELRMCSLHSLRLQHIFANFVSFEGRLALGKHPLIVRKQV